MQEYKQKGHSTEKLEKILDFSKLKGSPLEIEQSYDTSKQMVGMSYVPCMIH